VATALITGGTSGIGAGFARQLAARGDDLVLVARDSNRLAEMATQLEEKYGVGVETISADLGVRDEVMTVAKRLASTEQPVDMLVNSAGFRVPHKLVLEDTSAHEHGIDLMIRAVLILAAAAGLAMRARGRGQIINVSSTAGFVTMDNYSAIKAWVTTYSEGLANELAPDGVTVTALCPGYVRTEFHQRASIRTGSIPGPLWVDLDDLVTEALADVAKGKVISIPTRRFKVMIFAARHFPRAAIRAVSRRMSSTRTEDSE
jgi:short-subunit dehydrogenase